MQTDRPNANFTGYLAESARVDARHGGPAERLSLTALQSNGLVELLASWEPMGEELLECEELPLQARAAL